ncbi:hypothetical protein C922_02813 [Plasmodium inui San Antonio 1]|uniref:Uncharacterized protein n=1 Tax=Plasmodium inui San Antonio 1 TaxID=1237626 RepID=W7A6H5_9APIC|nr:hypothetical protein C922_02813 [Plasmodium inui San Antonio 1]EUD66828.1 hypothetical protein C922_02813 [Plasmodium inui San Antonio 1]
MKLLRSVGCHVGCPPQIQRSRRTINKTSNVYLGNNYVNLSTLREWVKGEGEEAGLRGPHGITPMGSNGNHVINHPPSGLKSRKMFPSASHSQEGSSTETEAVKNKVELLMRRNTQGTINDTVFQILSVINQHPKNKDVYINKKILISFHTLLIRRKYHLRISKGSICNDLHPTIFHYIHHNVSLHLKHYNLSNISKLLPGVSKYMHRVNPSESTKQLVQNIFYFHFFSHFNYFYYLRRRDSSLDSFAANHEGGAFPKKSGSIYQREQPPGGQENGEQFCKNGIHTEGYFHPGEKNPSDRRTLQLGTLPNGRFAEYPLKRSRCGDPSQRDQVTFCHLNSYVVFLSNHPMYASEKVLHIISLLANKVTQVNVSGKLALSFLSSSMNIFDKQKGDRRKILLYRKVNYDILYAIIREWNEQVGGVADRGEELLSGEEHTRDLPQSAHTNEESRSAPPPFVPNLWAYSHIINILKILKVKNFLSSKFSFSGDPERCLVQLFSGAMSLLASFTRGTSPDIMREECVCHWTSALTQNALNSIATIYVNMSILLSEVEDSDTLRSSLMHILNSCYSIVHTYYPMLHENMSINLVRGICYQMKAYSDMRPFRSCFYEMEEVEAGKDHLLCGDSHSKKEEALIVPKRLLQLLREVTNCLLFPSREEKKLPTNKLIIVLHYLHKVNKICLPFSKSDMLKGSILKLLHEIGKQIESEEETNVSNHHVLILMNVELSERGGKLNVPLLHACLTRLQEATSHLFENEAEIILFLYFLKRFPEATKICDPSTNSEHPIQHGDETFLFSREAASNRSLDEVNKMVTQLADRVTRVVFFPREATKLSLSRGPNSAISPNWFNQTLLTRGPHKMYPLRVYPLRVYFLAYEHISPDYPNEEPVKDALLNQLTRLMQLQKEKLTEEDFFSIMSSLLKHKIVDHNAYLLYESFLRSRGGLIRMKYVSLVLKRILEEISGGNLLRISTRASPSQVGADSPLISIITTSSDLILRDKQYRENFPFFKEILHVYLEKYPRFGDITPQFNLFLLAHFNNFVCIMGQLSEHEMARLVYHMASFYYTINKFSHDGFGVFGTENNSSCDDITNNWGGEKEEVKIGGDSIGSSRRLLCNSPPHNDAKRDSSSHVNSQGAITLHSGKDKMISYNEQDMGKKLLQQLNCLLDALYTEEQKLRERNDQMKLSLSSIIQVFTSLKNAKLRHSDLMRVLSERCIHIIMFSQRSTIKLELQIRFFNSVVFLDYLNAVDEAFLRLAHCHPGSVNNTSMQPRHILYAHFQQLPRQAICTPNISTYLLNFVSILDYLPLDHQRRGTRKASYWLCELLQMFFPKQVGRSTSTSTEGSKKDGLYCPPPNNLVKRNVFLLLCLLHLGNYSHVNISTFPLKFLQQFYSHFIQREFAHLSVNSTVRSSSTHRSIYNFLETYLRKEFPRYDIYNEKEVLLFKVDLVLLVRRHSDVPTCVC